MRTTTRIFIIILIAGLTACKQKAGKEKTETAPQTEQAGTDTPLLSEKAFDTIIDGKQVGLYWIESSGIKAAFTNYGGRLIGLWVPDKDGKITDVVWGPGSISGYTDTTEPYFGATIGRVGNRIAKGKFTLNGKTYSIPVNNGENSLHGGKKGFQDVVWEAEQPDKQTLVLHYNSPDMEEGFPGNLDVQVTYSIAGNTLRMEYEAITDKATPVNLTNHAFFNLNGEGSGSILEHKARFYADQFTPVDDGLIPTGELRDVKGTPFDFTEPHTIGERIETDNEQLKYGKGYDHNFVLNNTPAEGMNHAATVTGDRSGIVMDVYTEEPGMQFYSGNFMQGKNTFKSGAKDEFRTAFALETQHFPDAPNQPDFPSIILNPGETYHTVSLYRFSLTP
ncbi:aldose epimerase family protein [Sinomicrobium soli]|uniref:aldose epimerase family protein n=1 Tax=Sinomicrobium sp. N-1-3-6 TaxID=2219864 RepID=UPI000DCD2DA0|nr:aldose epimerase family protein [Sinomicrobium sp. N-1-3-6]RAV30893.1 galactose-1-epimerase [Sinomicrobium sp. N-1-3-6]